MILVRAAGPGVPNAIPTKKTDKFRAPYRKHGVVQVIGRSLPRSSCSVCFSNLRRKSPTLDEWTNNERERAVSYDELTTAALVGMFGRSDLSIFNRWTNGRIRCPVERTRFVERGTMFVYLNLEIRRRRPLFAKRDQFSRRTYFCTLARFTKNYGWWRPRKIKSSPFTYNRRGVARSRFMYFNNAAFCIWFVKTLYLFFAKRRRLRTFYARAFLNTSTRVPRSFTLLRENRDVVYK